MKEETFNLVIELLEAIHQDSQFIDEDQLDIIQALEDAGVPQMELDRTVEWLSEFSRTNMQRTVNQPSTHSVRVFSAQERQKITSQARQWIIQLENLGIINTILREQIIERVMACDFDEVSVTHTQWIAYLVLAHYGNEQSAWLTDIIMPSHHESVTAH
jgi:Smg protein